MITLNLTITNPWSDRFEPVYANGGKLTEHKAWELETYRSDTVTEFEFRLSMRQDHAGLTLGLGLFSWTIRIQLYDTRHWNTEKKDWYDYN